MARPKQAPPGPSTAKPSGRARVPNAFRIALAAMVFACVSFVGVVPHSQAQSQIQPIDFFEPPDILVPEGGRSTLNLDMHRAGGETGLQVAWTLSLTITVEGDGFTIATDSVNCDDPSEVSKELLCEWFIPDSGAGIDIEFPVWISKEDDADYVEDQATYCFSVAGEFVNDNSWCATATEVENDEPPTPDAPTQLGATSCEGGAVTLSWQAPAIDDSAPITGYQYQQQAGSGGFGSWMDIPGSPGESGPSYTITGLADGMYEFRVRGVSDNGPGTPSDSTGPTQCGVTSPEPPAISPGPPGSPTDLVAIPGDARVMLRWREPDDDGGAAIMRYEYRQRAAQGAFGSWTVIPDSGPGGSHRTSYTVTGLTNGTEYTFMVRAVNAASAPGPGLESVSAPASATPASSVQRREAVEGAIEGTIRAVLGNTVAALRNRSAPRGGASAAARPTANLGLVPAGGTAAPLDDWDPLAGDGMFGGSRTLGLDELLASGGFEVPLSAAEDGVQGMGRVRQWTFWGMGDLQHFEGQPKRGPTYDGGLEAGHLGAEALGDGWLAGLSVSLTRSETDYSLGEGTSGEDGRVQMHTVGVQPYVHYDLDDRSSLFATLGLIGGEIETQDVDGSAQETSDISMWLTSLGARRSLAPIEKLDLAVLGDVSYARAETEEEGHEALTAIPALTVEAWTVRAGVEGSHTATLSQGRFLTSFVELAGRVDGGGSSDDEFGLEISPGLYLSAPNAGVGIEVRGRVLAAHTAENVREHGLTVNAHLTPQSSDGAGLSLVLSPQWGAETNGADTLWSGDSLGQSSPQSAARNAMSFNARIGYGIRAHGGLLTPYGALRMQDQDHRQLRLGTRFDLKRFGTRALSLDFSGQRRETTREDPEYRVGVTGRLQF